MFWERHIKVSLLTPKKELLFQETPLPDAGSVPGLEQCPTSGRKSKIKTLFLILCTSHRQVAKLLQGQYLAVLIAAALHAPKPDAFVQICLNPVSSWALLNEAGKKMSILAQSDTCACLCTVLPRQRSYFSPAAGAHIMSLLGSEYLHKLLEVFKINRK